MNNVYPQYSPAPVYAGQTFVITNQPIRTTKRNWSVGYCDIFHDCGDFCLAFWLPPFYSCCLFSRADEHCCSCVFGGLTALRTKIRTERAISGTICGDFFAVACCPLCAMLQMGNEISNNQPII